MQERGSQEIQDRELTLIDLLVVIAEHSRLLLFGPVFLGLVALGLSFLVAPTFTGRATILPPQQQQSAASLLVAQLGSIGGFADSAGLGLKSPSDLVAGLLRSRTIADRLLDRFELQGIYDTPYRERAREALADLTNISVGKDGLVAIEVDDTDRQRAADLANAYIEELLKLTNTLALTEAQQRRVFFERQLSKANENLKEAQLALNASGIPQSLIKSSPEAAVESVARLRAQITALEVRIGTMRSFLSDQSPELERANQELHSLRKQLQQQERSYPSHATTSHAEYLNRYRDFKYQEALFDLMAKQYEVARLDEAREGSVIQVVDRAVPPELRSKPRRALIAVVTVLVSVFLLLAFTLFRDLFIRSARDHHVESKLVRIRQGFRKLGWPR